MLSVCASFQFEQENQRLIGEMNSLFDEVRYVCSWSLDDSFPRYWGLFPLALHPCTHV